MTKFIVGYEYDPIAITKTLSDAEELLLSIAEENAYEEFLYSVDYDDENLETYANMMRENCYYRHLKTVHAVALCNSCRGYWINECEYLS